MPQGIIENNRVMCWQIGEFYIWVCLLKECNDWYHCHLRITVSIPKACLPEEQQQTLNSEGLMGGDRIHENNPDITITSCGEEKPISELL